MRVDPPLHTDRLTLREFVESDWQAVHAYAADPQVVRFMAWGPNTEEETREFIRRVMSHQDEAERRQFRFAVVLAAQERLIGACSLCISNPANREAWIGYVYHRDAWGHGYATEVAGALVAFGFGRLGLHRIFATCDPRNTGSARVLEKAGMTREGHLRQHKWERGAWRDSYLYAVLEDEWTVTRDA